jgi:nicotinate-nucleotide adenylyltransferase
MQRTARLHNCGNLVKKWENATMRIGIFGGTFDPIHLGHVNAIRYSRDQANLDLIFVVVAGDPYQKDTPGADAAQRLSWVQMACDEAFPDDDSVIVDDREVRRNGPSYTVDTLEEIQAEYPEAELVLIVGEDIPETMSSWKEHDKIGQMAELFVVPRTIFPASSTHIRSCFAENKPLAGVLPAQIETEIREKALYTKTTRSKE